MEMQSAKPLMADHYYLFHVPCSSSVLVLPVVGCVASVEGLTGVYEKGDYKKNIGNC